jgi:hypothetical protein
MEYRQPDESIREQLLPDNRSEFQKQLDQALLLSLKEEDEKLLKHEEEIINNYNAETNRRTELFTPLKI